MFKFTFICIGHYSSESRIYLSGGACKASRIMPGLDIRGSILFRIE